MRCTEVLRGTMLRGKMFFSGITILLLTLWPLVSQSTPPADAITTPSADPQIAAALKNISAQRVQQTVEKLVSFQTRHTLSSDQPASAGKGINSAAEWIKSQFETYSKACGGCL